MMLKAKEPVTRKKFLLLPAAWCTPSAVSTLKTLVSAALFAACTVPALPDTAVRGDTPAAFFAGAPAARSTVTRPINVPATRLKTLTPNAGILSKSPGLNNRSIPQAAHTVTTPARSPAGTASLHQPSASLFTKQITCLFVAPRQRIIPKNSVLRAILLFMLAAIIKIPATATSTASTAATK